MASVDQALGLGSIWAALTQKKITASLDSQSPSGNGKPCPNFGARHYTLEVFPCVFPTALKPFAC